VNSPLKIISLYLFYTYKYFKCFLCTYGQLRKCWSNPDAACDHVLIFNIFLYPLYIALLPITSYLFSVHDLFHVIYFLLPKSKVALERINVTRYKINYFFKITDNNNIITTHIYTLLRHNFIIIPILYPSTCQMSFGCVLTDNNASVRVILIVHVKTELFLMSFYILYIVVYYIKLIPYV